MDNVIIGFRLTLPLFGHTALFGHTCLIWSIGQQDKNQIRSR